MQALDRDTGQYVALKFIERGGKVRRLQRPKGSAPAAARRRGAGGWLRHSQAA